MSRRARRSPKEGPYGWTGQQGSGTLALHPDALMRAASDETGLDDYGDGKFLEPLRRYCTALVDEARLNPAGLALTCSCKLSDPWRRACVSRLT